MREDNIGEWQEERNIWGGVKRFRMVGGIKEYEMEIQTADGISVPESQLEEYNKSRNKNAVPPVLKPVEGSQQPKNCPILCGRGMMHTECLKECVFFGENGCEFRPVNPAGNTDCKGQKCPFKGKCDESCAMYGGGCGLLEFVKNTKKGRKKQ